MSIIRWLAIGVVVTPACALVVGIMYGLLCDLARWRDERAWRRVQRRQPERLAAQLERSVSVTATVPTGMTNAARLKLLREYQQAFEAARMLGAFGNDLQTIRGLPEVDQ